MPIEEINIIAMTETIMHTNTIRGMRVILKAAVEAITTIEVVKVTRVTITIGKATEMTATVTIEEAAEVAATMTIEEPTEV